MPGEEATVSGAAPVPIAVFVGSWLPFSETFVYEQLRWQRLTQAHVFATSRTKTAQRFPYQPLHVLGLGEQLGYRYLGLAPSIPRALEASGSRLAFAHFGLNGAFALPFARRLGLPLVVMFHGHDVGGLLPQNRLSIRYARYQLLSKSLFDYASRLFCASEELAERLGELGAPKHKLRVHRLGIDVERFTPAVSADKAPVPTVLMVGRLVEKKGMEFGLRAFERLHRTVPNAELRIVGAGPLGKRLAQEAASLKIQDAVRFLGPLPQEAVHREMRAAHVLMTPSVTTASGDRESGVIVLKEAAATGLPAIGTRHGGIPEIIEQDQTGLLVDERNVEQLARGLKWLLGQPVEREKMGLNARAKMLREYDNRLRVLELEQQLIELL